jgi:hypothetical protein
LKGKELVRSRDQCSWGITGATVHGEVLGQVSMGKYWCKRKGGGNEMVSAGLDVTSSHNLVPITTSVSTCV